MSFEASVRYALLPAPAGLTLVQDLLNTIAAGRQPDLLATAELAAPWLDVLLFAGDRLARVAGRNDVAPEIPACDPSRVYRIPDKYNEMIREKQLDVFKWAEDTGRELVEVG